MAPRRRAVERAALRQGITDRIVIGVLVVVAASGLMSVLPAYSQVAVSRFVCRAASLGLGACGSAGIDLENTQLAPARCATLSTLDRSIPAVRVAAVTTGYGLPVTIAQSRAGDVFVHLGRDDPSDPPYLLDGQVRASRQVLADVAVPGHTEWFLPRGAGLDQLVLAAHDRHQRGVERQSALALVGSGLFGGVPELPPPALLYSRVRLDQQSLPQFADDPEPPRTGRVTPPERLPTAPANRVSVVPGGDALVILNRITRETATVATLTGAVRQQPVTGTVRFTRNAEGRITSVLVAIVSAARMVPKEPLGSLPGPAVAYISIPVRTAPEQELVRSWISAPDGFSLPLSQLLGLAKAGTDDQLGSFLTRAATVTLLRYAFVTPTELQRRVATELSTLRWQEWTGVRMVEASSIAPQPSGGTRTLITDPPCRT